jgi:uncharacterized protein with ParB-like and HNH nuclease domain
MSTITPHYRTLTMLLQSRSFAIDEYQREYQWARENIEELLSDLVDKFMSCYQVGHDPSHVTGYEGYYLGAIIVSQRETKSYVVDGQQRVTSLTLLLIHLYHLATERELPVASTLAPLIFSDNYGTPSFNLDIPERLPAIKALFRKEEFTPDGKDESIQTMLARYENIRERNLGEELGEGLTSFIYWLMKNVGLIEIVTDNDNYAYAIFETMNDRGKPLSPVDMLKAYVLAPITDETQRPLANSTWKSQIFRLISWNNEVDQERDDHCIKAWLRAQHAETIRDRRAGSTDRDWELAGSAFHRWARENAVRLGLGTADQNLQFIQRDLPFFASSYLAIQEASRIYKPGLEAVFYNAHNEFTWQSTVLLAALVPTDDLETQRKKMAAVATFLDIWIMRRVVNYVRVGYSSASYAMFNVCKEIRRKPLDELAETLLAELGKDDATFAGSPSRERKGLRDLRLNQFSRRYLIHLLARVTAFVEKESGGHDLFHQYVDRAQENSYDIEHILPAKADLYEPAFGSSDSFGRTRDSVASLLLLPADVNRSLQDKPYTEKRAVYAGQNLWAASLTDTTYVSRPQFAFLRAGMTHPPSALSEFGPGEWSQRMDTICEIADRIWDPNRIREIVK